MQVRLDRGRAEDRQVRLVREDLLVRKHVQALRLEIEPVRDLVVGDKINLSDPWRVLDQGTQGVSQLFAVSVPVRRPGIVDLGRVSRVTVQAFSQGQSACRAHGIKAHRYALCFGDRQLRPEHALLPQLLLLQTSQRKQQRDQHVQQTSKRAASRQTHLQPPRIRTIDPRVHNVDGPVRQVVLHVDPADVVRKVYPRSLRGGQLLDAVTNIRTKTSAHALSSHGITRSQSTGVCGTYDENEPPSTAAKVHAASSATTTTLRENQSTYAVRAAQALTLRSIRAGAAAACTAAFAAASAARAGTFARASHSRKPKRESECTIKSSTAGSMQCSCGSGGHALSVLQATNQLDVSKNGCLGGYQKIPPWKWR